jgi:hypothetical protein
MTARPDTPLSRSLSALRPFLQRPARLVEERCDLCAEPIGSAHRHILDISTRSVLCACRACVILFNSAAAGAGARRLIPDTCLYLANFSLGEMQWDALQVPVNIAFFQRGSIEGRMQAFYPSPMGATESRLTFESWHDLEQANPILRRMKPDVEALLISRLRQSREYFLAPIDECYKLVGLIRGNWRGLSGGAEVWPGIERYFAELKARATVVEAAHA